MSLRVLLASHSATLDAGAERSLLQICLYLRDRGAEVAVTTPGEGVLGDALRAEGIEVTNLRYDWARPPSVNDATDRSLSALRDLRDHLRSRQPDVVVTNTLVIPWFGFIAHQLGIRHAWFIREDLSNDPGFAYPDAEATLRLIGATADGVFVPSEYMRELYGRLLGRDDVRVVYPTFDRTIADWAGRRPASTGRRIVVCATVAPHKNQLEALRAAAILKAGGCDFEMTLIGGVASREYLGELTDFVRGQDLGGVVSIKPATDEPYEALAAHDVCVVPSTNEPSSRVMVEAMLVGTAVVASDIGGNVEKAGSERRAALLYPLGDPEALAERLATLLDDPPLSRKQAERGHAYAVEMYVQRDQLAPLLAGLEQIAAQPAPAPGTWLIDELVERSAELQRVRAAQQTMRLERDDAVAGRERSATRVAQLAADVQKLTAQVADLEDLARIYASSRSWRMTEPARALGRGARRVIGSGQRRDGG